MIDIHFVAVKINVNNFIKANAIIDAIIVLNVIVNIITETKKILPFKKERTINTVNRV